METKAEGVVSVTDSTGKPAEVSESQSLIRVSNSKYQRHVHKKNLFFDIYVSDALSVDCRKAVTRLKVNGTRLGSILKYPRRSN